MPPAEIAARIERQTVRLIGLGRTRADAGRDAVAIVRAELRNDPRLYQPQGMPSLCHVCGGPESSACVLVPVLTALPGERHWLHRACHDEHVARMAAKADALIEAAR